MHVFGFVYGCSGRTYLVLLVAILSCSNGSEDSCEHLSGDVVCLTDLTLLVAVGFGFNLRLLLRFKRLG